MYGWNVGQQTNQKIAQFLGFSRYAAWEKINYLKLPLTLGTNKASLWVEVISKTKKKIAGWGVQWLNNAGKLILIKLVLSSLPIFQESFLLAPNTITKQV